MLPKASPPLLTLTFTVSSPIYQACVLMLAMRIKQKNMPRSLVIGGLFVAGGIAFLAYLFLYLRTADTVITLLSVLLMLLGVYNLVYYPVLFEGIVKRSAARRYEASSRIGRRVTLQFHDEYIDEIREGETIRTQWSSLLAIHREQLYYLLRLTPDSGIIIPRTELNEEQTGALEYLLDTKPIAGI